MICRYIATCTCTRSCFEFTFICYNITFTLVHARTLTLKKKILLWLMTNSSFYACFNMHHASCMAVQLLCYKWLEGARSMFRHKAFDLVSCRLSCQSLMVRMYLHAHWWREIVVHVFGPNIPWSWCSGDLFLGRGVVGIVSYIIHWYR